MPDILLDLPINAAPAAVFESVATPAGLDRWWTLRSQGAPRLGSEYRLDFGPKHQWRGRVMKFAPFRQFALEIVDADDDWRNTRVGFKLEPRDRGTWLRFSHRGWPARNEHYRISCNCWAAYLRVLRRALEYGEAVPYHDRLTV